jgi:predicted lipid-binding transport protein (Tim44 family)
MSDERPPTRRDLMKPVQLLGLSFIAALFAGLVTLLAMGFFQQRFAGESGHAVIVALIVAGITFIVTVVVIALLLLVVDPAQVAKPIERPLLVEDDERNALKAAKKDAAKGATTSAPTTRVAPAAPAPGTAPEAQKPVEPAAGAAPEAPKPVEPDAAPEVGGEGPAAEPDGSTEA